MIALALLALLQTAPSPAPAPEPVVEEQDIVVTAKLGHTTMLFDKGSDGKLRNCRIMKSSGSQRRDTEACQATPVCYVKTIETVSDCVDLIVTEPGRVAALPPGASDKPAVFDIPKLAQPKPLAVGTLGPIESDAESRDTERQRVKLPPLPRSPTSGPVITFTNGKTEEKK